MKFKLTLFTFFTCLQLFSQKDSIVNYYDKNKKIVTDKTKARFFEILTKQNDTLWLSKKYRRNGNIYHYQHFTSKDKKNKIGESIRFDKHNKMVELTYFNRNGLQHGKYKSWFTNGNINTVGKFINGNKEGLFKIYHYKGVLAGKGIFKNDSLIREIYYNSKGVTTDIKDVICKQQPIFKGGKEKYKKELKKLSKNLKFKIDGEIFVNYTIGINGNITDVTLDEKIPVKLHNYIVHFFESLKGWSPAIDRNRKMPYNFTQKLRFKK